jgi:hypothetical protein
MWSGGLAKCGRDQHLGNQENGNAPAPEAKDSTGPQTPTPNPPRPHTCTARLRSAIICNDARVSFGRWYDSASEG